MAVYPLHENVVTSRHDHREMQCGCGLEDDVGSRLFPQKPHIPFRVTYVMDYSELKLGQKNGNPGTDADLAYF